MKLPIPFLLYTSALGLAGFTGWQVYELLPLQKAETKREAMNRGTKAATDRISVGRGRGQVTADWLYSDKNRAWWDQLKKANFIGKLPPPPVDPAEAEGNQEPEIVTPPQIPLEDIIELSALMYDGADKGQGALSHVVVRYKPESGVQPPEWYVRQNSVAATGYGGPPDGVPPPRAGGNQNFRPNRSGNPQAPPRTTSMPTATGPSVLLQEVWIQGEGDPRRDPHLWPPFDHIKLVRVDPTAQLAYFVREGVPSDENPDPTTQAKPEEEPLYKSTASLSQEVLAELHRLYGERGTPRPEQANENTSSQRTWIESEQTQLVNGVRHIGRQDEQAFSNESDFFEKVYFDTYSSKVPGSTVRGLQVTNLPPQLATTYGVVKGDVLLSVNGRKVQSKAQAVQFGKKEYKKGVREFVTTWLSQGQEVERIYQLPDK